MIKVKVLHYDKRLMCHKVEVLNFKEAKKQYNFALNNTHLMDLTSGGYAKKEDIKEGDILEIAWCFPIVSMAMSVKKEEEE